MYNYITNKKILHRTVIKIYVYKNPPKINMFISLFSVNINSEIFTRVCIGIDLVY